VHVCVRALLAMPQIVAVEDKKPAHCGTLIQTANGGSFSSPNYPSTYPPNKECVYILEGMSLTSTSKDTYSHALQLLFKKKIFL